MSDKVLVIGSGGREHALGWRLRQSPHVAKVYFAPGNAGTALEGENVALKHDNLEDFKRIAEFVQQNSISLTVVGPEAPLVAGIVDYFNDAELPERGYYIFGPAKEAAMLEGSKAWAKKFMKACGIPTADFRVFDKPEHASDYIKYAWGKAPLVVKADGLAAGKGVIVPQSREEAINAVNQIMVKKNFGDAGNAVILEERLKGEEVSMLAFCDGEKYKMLVSSQDHKQAYDGDKGPNTGGMGAYAPAPVVTQNIENVIRKEIFECLIKDLVGKDINYRGVIYAGLMITNKGPMVLEFNVRFGDPETQPIAMLSDFDWYEAMLGCAQGDLDAEKIRHKSGASCCVVMASGGYPDKYEKGKEILGLEDAAGENIKIFHAGTKLVDGKVYTSGGRVLGVTAYGKDIAEAQKTAYASVGKISWGGEFHRKDIGNKAIARR